MAEEYWKSSPFGEDSIFHPSWEEKQRLARLEQQKGKAFITLLNKKTIFSIKTDILLKFQLTGETGFFNDTEYKVTLSSSNSNLQISTKSWTGENDYKLYTTVSLDKPGKVSIYISIDGIKKHTFEIEFIKSKDVFTTVEINNLKDEFLYMSNFVDDHIPNEYSGNYCMQGADRALGKLLNNTSDFYVVERKTHKIVNSISFNNLNTYSRAKQYNSKGYIYTEYEIDNKFWNIDHEKRKKINGSVDYSAAQTYAKTIQYDLVWVDEAKGKSTLALLKKLIDEKEPSWHVFYLSIVDGFHTQILLIDNTDRDIPKYEIWEDHGLSSSSGSLNDLIDGLNRQTSSMFTVSCLFRYQNGTTDKWDSQTLKVWKIKSK